MQPEKITCYSHSVTQNNVLEEPIAADQKQAATTGEDKTKPVEQTTAQGTSETDQTKSAKEESQSERIRKRIQEKREQQQQKEEEITAKTTDSDSEQRDNNDNNKPDDKKDEEYLSNFRDEL